MEVKIAKWGNSNGVRIPASILKELNIEENEPYDVKGNELW